MIKGVPASGGIGFGKPLAIRPPQIDTDRRPVKDPVKESARLTVAAAVAKERLRGMIAGLDPERDKEAGEILNTHLMMLDDPELFEAVEACVKNECVCCEYAIHLVTGQLADQLASVDDPLIRARAADIAHVGHAVLQALTGEYDMDARFLPVDTVLVAADIAPTFLVSADKANIRAIICEKGSPTSHIAILCKAAGIPAVFGIEGAVERLGNAENLLVNGSTGVVERDLPPERQRQVRDQLEKLARLRTFLEAYRLQEGRTADGKRTMVAANIGNEEEARVALEAGAEGIGLFRTEFMYMDCQSAPSEEYQYQIYRKVLDVFGGREVTIRTLDAGGDKEIPYLSLPKEDNPFLGKRAIRMCMGHQALFLTQLRALLRAGKDRNLRIMVPMISYVDEIRRVRTLMALAATQLEKEGMPYSRDVKLGAMIEVPSAAICADQLAREVDFFSIGTNDLTQYILAADRNNPGVASVYSEFQPAVLRMIDRVARCAHTENIPVGVCGELAGNVLATALLLGMECEELSVSPASLCKVKRAVSCVNTASARRVASEAIDCRTKEEVLALMDQQVELMGLKDLLLLT